jgi:hypothetical protein
MIAHMPDPGSSPLLDLVRVMDENWGMISVAMRLASDPRYLDAFARIDRAFRVARAAAERKTE